MKRTLHFLTALPSIKSMFSQFFVILALICTAFETLQAQAVNPKISIQGTLKSASGSSVADGAYSVTFKLYTVQTGGTALWEEDATVEVIGGIYSHYLGSITPLNPANFATPLFLGVKVGSYELIPRTELAYSPYAFSVNSAQTVVCSGAVGDVKYSILNPTQFAAVNGACWVPMDGRSMAATDQLRIITALTNVPDGGGLFLRSQEFSTSPDYDKSRTSASTIATVQTEAVQSHTHGVTDPEHSHGYQDLRHGSLGIEGMCTCPGSTLYPASEGAFSEPRTTSKSATGISIQNAGGPETRPANINLWVYIRIN